MVQIFKPKASNSLKGKLLTLDIERLDFNGRGVARYQKKPIFVDGALPNEQVVAKVTEQSSKFCQGKLTKVITASKHRIEPQCKYFGRCGGCDLQQIDKNQHINIKQEKVSELFSRQKIDDLPWQVPVVEDVWQYRRKARIGVQYNRHGKAILGFREKGTNNVTQISQCQVLLKPLSDLLEPLTKTVNQLPAQSIGHIELIYTYHKRKPLITIVIRQLKKLNDKIKALWHEFVQTRQVDGHIQVIFDKGAGTELESLTPIISLGYQVDKDVEISFEANNFIQVNEQVNESMIEQALIWLNLSGTDKVLDLYCGLGNFSLPIAKRVEQVVGIEGVDEMVEKAQVNAQLNQLTNASFYQANLNTKWQSASWLSQKYTKILLDPARAGALEACQQLSQFNASDVVYVSCDPATLARDSVVLLSQGYRLAKIAIMEMFGQTKHVETMVLFQRMQS